MSPLEKNLVPALLAITGLYILYTKPFVTALTTFGLGAVLYTFTKSSAIVLVLFLVSLTMRNLNALFEPAGPVGVAEAFQPKDPLSIHARIAKEKDQAPLQPKVGIANITGVLESPSILDNVPLKPMQELTSDATPGASIPASAKARVLIYPPEEGFVPAPQKSEERRVREVPYLQNGPDDEGVETAMAEKGTDGVQPEMMPSDIPSVDPSQNPAF